jgi:hypothetical protein
MAVHKGSRYLAEDVKVVTAFVRSHYGKKDVMTAFTVERQAMQQEIQRRVDAADVYEIWARRACWTRRSIRDDEVKHMRKARHQA